MGDESRSNTKETIAAITTNPKHLETISKFEASIIPS